jgi:taurine dioxygenase
MEKFMKFTRLDAPFGAAVTDIDLARDLTADEFEAIRRNLAEHAVLLFPAQEISPQDQVRFSRGLGTMRVPLNDQYALPGLEGLHKVSNILENGRNTGLPDAGVYWHTDGAYLRTPDLCTMLYSIEVPRDPQGAPLGATTFTNTALAYDALPDEMKKELAPLRAEFTVLLQYEKKKASGILKREELTDEQKAKAKPVLHPVIRTHPQTGRKCIYVSESHTSRILGVSESRSKEWIDYLLAHIVQPQVLYRHDWSEHDFLLWDNPGTQHQASFNYQLPQRRLMYRTSCVGTEPY